MSHDKQGNCYRTSLFTYQVSNADECPDNGSYRTHQTNGGKPAQPAQKVQFGHWPHGHHDRARRLPRWLVDRSVEHGSIITCGQSRTKGAKKRTNRDNTGGRKRKKRPECPNLKTDICDTGGELVRQGTKRTHKRPECPNCRPRTNRAEWGKRDKGDMWAKGTERS
jgi:hypothetical protein